MTLCNRPRIHQDLLEMTSHDVEPDPPLTSDQLAIVGALSREQVADIDKALLGNCLERWRKVAAVVGFTMTDQLMNTFEGVPDVYYAQRIRELVEKGTLEAAGNLGYMRYSEVRFRQDGDE
jgi:hypothetical protein